MVRWYVVQTHPRAEAAAERRLNAQNFSTHLPRRTVRLARHGKITHTASPCFPGYLFVQLDIADDAWKATAYTRGVLRILPRSETPVSVPAMEIAALRDAERQGAFHSGAVKPGERLRVLRGVLARQVVHCLQVHDDRGIITALFSCLGQQARTTIKLDNVAVVQ